MEFENNSIQAQEFLERSLGQKVKSYHVTPGCNVGDGYATLHSAIKVEFFDGAISHYFLKSCPSNPTRQEAVKAFNIFFKEFKFYTEIIPEFMKFQESILNGKKPIEFSIPEIVAGNAINYLENPAAGAGKIEKFEDNYILMKDMRKEHGFIKQDTFHRVTYAEMEKIILELAKLHAVSWAYKKKHGIDSLTQKFPYWVQHFYGEAQVAAFGAMVSNGRDVLLKMVAEKFGEKSDIFIRAQEFYKDVDKTWSLACKMTQARGMNEKDVEEVLKSPLKPNMEDPIEDSWTVLTQFVNNMLFKYDSQAQIQKVCLPDFQMSHETCPTIELTYALYLCGDYELRSKHWSKIPRFYHETLMGFFEYFGVEPFPGFTLENLERRLHRSRIYGILAGAWFNPIIFNDPGQIKSMEDYDLVKEMANEGGIRSELKKSNLEITKEAYE